LKVSEALSISTTSVKLPAAGSPAPPSVDRFRLQGPSITLDTRINAVRRDIADVALAGRLFAPHYARPELCACAADAAMLRSAPQEDATAVSQLLHGEGFAMLDIAAGWAWGFGLHDHYVGYVRCEALGAVSPPTHIVTAPAAPVFSRPDIKSAVGATLSMGARLAAEPDGAFLRMTRGFVHRRHAAPLDQPATDAVAVAERLIGSPYLWGGRGAGGIDCSGLVQLSLGLTGLSAPRDSDQQRALLGRALAPEETAARGDLIFFPGHVGFMLDHDRLLHANAHWMAVTAEPLADVIVRAGGEDALLARRRIAP
jgi:cell wall-associated NlpC family hydrolase